jgi:hypothetical protein
VVQEQQARIRSILEELKRESHDPKILEKVIRLYAIGIERKHIKSLFEHGEVSEAAIKRVVGKLEYQTYAIEHDMFDPEAHEHGQSPDLFEFLANFIRTITLKTETEKQKAVHDYLYYRGLTIISRKVVKELGKLDSCFDSSFNASHEVVRTITAIYERYREGSQKKMDEVIKMYPKVASCLNEELARKALYMRESSMLDELKAREMVTPKVSIMLAERLKSESEPA